MEVNLKQSEIPKSKRSDSGIFPRDQMEKQDGFTRGQMKVSPPHLSCCQGCKQQRRVSLFRPLFPWPTLSSCTLFFHKHTPSLSKHLVPGPSLCRATFLLHFPSCTLCGILVQLHHCLFWPPWVSASLSLAAP